LETLSFVAHTAAIELSTFLLSLVQAMISKLLLPEFGGGASIWITNMAFVGILFLSDGLGHWLIKYLGIKKHMVFALTLLIYIHDVDVARCCKWCIQMFRITCRASAVSVTAIR
jgi:hypothetical protein|tara:strand:+ start:165 stop:506 length:342 start_codon:yes stop_codon:yes gene_type:complete